MVQKGNPFSWPLRPRPVREAFSRRANHQFTLVVLIFPCKFARPPLIKYIAYSDCSCTRFGFFGRLHFVFGLNLYSVRVLPSNSFLISCTPKSPLFLIYILKLHDEQIAFSYFFLLHIPQTEIHLFFGYTH